MGCKMVAISYTALTIFEFEILSFELGAVSLLFEIIVFISLYHSLTTIIEVSSEETGHS